MKRCPTCEKTFDDNLRFCQADGTPLVDAVEEIDPYKTMVAKPGEIFAAIPKEPAQPEPPAPSVPSTGDDVLELPGEQDANKTQIVSEAEIRAEMAKADVRVEEIPPAAEPVAPAEETVPTPAPPKFIDPTPPPGSPLAEPPAEPPPSSEPAPSPFSSDLQGDPFQHTTPPIPSPFGDQSAPMGAMTPEPEPPQFAEPEPTPPPFIGGQVAQEPQAPAPIAQAEWTPPAAPDASWEGKEIGQNTPFEPPVEGAGAGQSKTLAIVSLIMGVFSILCCGFLSGIPAVIVGMMARGRIKRDPNAYAGGGFALVGILTGIFGTIFWLAFSVVYVYLYGTAGISIDGF